MKPEQILYLIPEVDDDGYSTNELLSFKKVLITFRLKFNFTLLIMYGNFIAKTIEYGPLTKTIDVILLTLYNSSMAS